MPAPARLTVATFNIRNAAADRGEHGWRNRRQACLQAIAALDADIVGLQEVLGRQQRALRRRFRAGTVAGVGRDDGRRRGERVGVLLRPPGAGDWDLIGIATRWLSPTPDVPGSLGWDAAFPRTLVIVSLRERTSGVTVAVATTHLDHAGARSRLESARLVLAIATATPDLPWVLVGDLNAEPDDPPIRTFLDAGWQAATSRQSRPTFHNWRPGAAGGRIDHILASPHWEIVDAEVVDDRSGRWSPGSPAGLRAGLPSDHWPVRAQLRLRPSAQHAQPSRPAS